jgi:hypothetical protein
MTDFLRDGERYHTLSDGTVLKVARDEDVMRDGQRMRVPLLMVDGVNPAPVFDAAHQRPRAGVRSLNDRARVEASHAMMVKRLNDAWRNPGLARVPAPQFRGTADDAAKRLGFTSPPAGSLTAEQQAQSDQAYTARCQKLEDAWKGAK